MLARPLPDALISEIAVRRLRLPLKTPYKLAFGPVDAFDTVLVILKTGKRLGVGEATILTGYTEETIEGSWELTRRLAGEIFGLDAKSAFAALEPYLKQAPFTVTAFRTAMEMASGHPSLCSDVSSSVRLLAILNATEPGDIEQELDAATAAGYSTVKVKVGFDIDADIARLRHIQRVAAGRFAITVDANQGYTREEGCRFAASIVPESILFFEQACSMHDWDAAVAVARASTVPVMLDESIYDLDDVRRAAKLRCADYVKLKLMKFGSLSALEQGIETVRALGIEPVLGNGVASDIGCWMEARIAAEHISTVGEMNGFLKPSRPIVRNPLVVESGRIHVPAHYSPVLDDAAIDAQTIDVVIGQ